MTPREAILARLRELISSGWSVHAIAKASGVAWTQVTKARSGRHVPDSNIKRFADLFGMPFGDEPPKLPTLPLLPPPPQRVFEDDETDGDFDESLIDARLAVWNAVSRGLSVAEAAELAGITEAAAEPIAAECPKGWLSPMRYPIDRQPVSLFHMPKSRKGTK